ncbi:MAG: maleylpyruvate isomerase family mycothiol-dependent enzyme [Acidimicrobiales bacterium]
MADVWAAVRPEREALAVDLETIDDTAWTTPSLCPGWTVRDVLAHMTALARMTPPRFFQKLLASGFNPARLQAKDIALEKGSTVEDTLRRFRAIAANRNGLPGQKKTLLGETLIHAEDIRRPLGITHGYPLESLVIVADFYRASNLLVGGKRRIDGLSLQATDINWSAGSGPVVKGPMLSVLMAMAGRQVAIADLKGDGVEMLRARP